ncbi:MAG: helix-turn-helix domain-containing protein, partial [Clostridiales bacterium]|nr:helix-turn-helix domain-containing protein [Clostridiales bacterium]
MSKHLSLTDRAIIEKYLAQDMSFAFIARRLDRSPTTISMEIRNHRCFVNGYQYTSNDCINYRSCLRRNLCDQETIYSCTHRCKRCTEFDCRTMCPSYVSMHCSLLDKPPYVCTCCPEEKTCKRSHAYYTAHRAHAECVKERSISRKGIRTSPERLLEINDLLAPLVAKGQSINHIFATHGT